MLELEPGKLTSAMAQKSEQGPQSKISSILQWNNVLFAIRLLGGFSVTITWLSWPGRSLCWISRARDIQADLTEEGIATMAAHEPVFFLKKTRQIHSTRTGLPRPRPQKRDDWETESV